MSREQQLNRPFTVDEVIKAIGTKLGEVRNDAKAAEERLRAEFEAKLEREVMRLRNEFLTDRLNEERSANRRSSPLPVHSIIELN